MFLTLTLTIDIDVNGSTALVTHCVGVRTERRWRSRPTVASQSSGSTERQRCLGDGRRREFQCRGLWQTSGR